MATANGDSMSNRNSCQRAIEEQAALESDCDALAAISLVASAPDSAPAERQRWAAQILAWLDRDVQPAVDRVAARLTHLRGTLAEIDRVTR